MRGILRQSSKLCSVLASDHKDTSTALLSFGNGSQGALGTGGTADEYEPERVQLPKSTAGVGAGHYHSFAITEGGGLWSWGRNNEQQLGRHVSALVDPLPGPVKALEGIRVTACTGSGVASLAATAEGRVFSWGASKRGQLGLGPGHAQSSQPSAIPGLEKIVQVAAGWGHALALDEDGQVFSWGFPQHGRLGHSFASAPAEDEEGAVLQRCVWAPKRIDALSGQQIQQVACGMDFSLAVAESGTVFAFGDNSLGQLGRPPGNRDNASSAAEDWILKDAGGSPLLVTKVAAGLGHSLAIDQSGGLIAWGWNSAGSSGPGTDAMHPHPAKLSAGRVHSLVVLPTEDSYSSHQGSAGNTDISSVEQGPRGGLSELYAWGNGRNGRLGLGCQDNEAHPVLVNVSGEKFYSPEWGGDMILDAACGFDHSLVLVCIESD